ncbi:MAG TPA: hypothetical protein EYP14_04830 [Planctomycetaceae bacterium]|nr:hypothetical protein [Planctomycetaceae bacterium]
MMEEEMGAGGAGGPGMEMGAPGAEMGAPGAEMGPGMGGPEGPEGPEGMEGMSGEMAGMDPGMFRGPEEGEGNEDQMEQEMAAMEQEMAKAMGGEEGAGMGMDEAQLAKEMEAMGVGAGPQEEGLEAEMRGALGPGGPGFGGGPEGGPGMGRGVGGGRPSFPEGSAQAAIFELVMQLRGEAKPEELVKVISSDAKGDLAELRDGKASDEKKAALKSLIERVKFIGRPRNLPGGKLQLVLENVQAGKLMRFICRREGGSYVIQEMRVMKAARRGHRR